MSGLCLCFCFKAMLCVDIMIVVNKECKKITDLY